MKWFDVSACDGTGVNEMMDFFTNCILKESATAFELRRNQQAAFRCVARFNGPGPHSSGSVLDNADGKLVRSTSIVNDVCVFVCLCVCVCDQSA